jgi:CheY-like chemotaxis protein
VKVLLVDDNTFIRKVVRAALEAEGMQCAEVALGGDALQYCAEEPPDACLLDLNLPDLDGLTVLKTLKGQERTRPVRVFILSGSDDPDLPSRARRLGAEGCLAKPLRAADLAVLLRGA